MGGGGGGGLIKHSLEDTIGHRSYTQNSNSCETNSLKNIRTHDL